MLVARTSAASHSSKPARRAEAPTSLPTWRKLSDRLGDVSLVVCLDSGAADYDALWMTTSLRGTIQAQLRVDVLERGMHSGLTGGLAPSSIRILRQLLDRIEDSTTGEILLDRFQVNIPGNRITEAQAAAAAGVDPRAEVAFVGDTRSDAVDAMSALLQTTWLPVMTMIGIDGVPALADAGNVMRPYTTLGLSFRIPPTCDPESAIEQLRRVLESDPPSGARVELTIVESSAGWNASPTEEWLVEALDDASRTHFGRPPGWWGLGGSIPFMALLGDRYPNAQFVITGVLGPDSNAHGPNEFLHLPTGRRVSACVAHVLDAHANRPGS